MKKRSIILLLTGYCLSCAAQTRYTDVIQRSTEGQGTLVLHQSKEISDLVNGVEEAGAATSSTPSVKKVLNPSATHSRQAEDTDTTSVNSTKNGPKVRVNGYRIQVYSGGNTRKGKMEAQMMGQRAKSMFDELPIYTHFVSPHWICRVGDFKTYEEANEYFRKMKATGRFDEAVIVRSKVSVAY